VDTFVVATLLRAEHLFTRVGLLYIKSFRYSHYIRKYFVVLAYFIIMAFYTEKTGFWALLIGTLLLLRFGSITANDSVHQNDLWKGQAAEENIAFSDTVYDRKLKSTKFENKGQKKDTKNSKKGKKVEKEKKAKKGDEEEEIDFDQLILEVLKSDPYLDGGSLGIQSNNGDWFGIQSNNGGSFGNINWSNETQVDDAVKQFDTAIGGMNELIDLYQDGFDPSDPEQLLKAIQQGLVIGSAFVPALAIVAGGLSVLANLIGARPEAAASITNEINKVLDRIDTMESTLQVIQDESRDIKKLIVWLTFKSELSEATNIWDTATNIMKFAIRRGEPDYITFARNNLQTLCNRPQNPMTMMNIIRKFATSSTFGYQQEWPLIRNSIDGRVKYFEKEFNTLVNAWTSKLFFMESFCRAASDGKIRLEFMKMAEKAILDGMEAKRAEVEAMGWINSVTGRCDRDEFSNPEKACKELAKHYEHDTRYTCFRVSRRGNSCQSQLPYDQDERAKIEDWDLSRPMTGDYGSSPKFPTSHHTIGSKTEDGTAITGNLRLICNSGKADDVLWILYDKRENDNTPDMERIDPWNTYHGELIGLNNMDFENQNCPSGRANNLCADPDVSCHPNYVDNQQGCESTKEHVLKNIPRHDPGLYQRLKDRAAVITTESRSNTGSGGDYQICSLTSKIYGHGISCYYNAYYSYEHWYYIDRRYTYAFNMIMLSDVWCGGHNAVSCRRCPWNGDVWVGPQRCNGDCKWVVDNSPDNEYGGKCTPKTYGV